MDHSYRLVELEEATAPRAARWFVVCFAIGFVALLGFDWFMRFERYEWETRLIDRPRRPISEPQARPAFVTNHVAAARGGDLTTLIGIRSVVDVFAEERPATIHIRDRHGFMNRPHDEGQAPDVVVLGDSFMAYGDIDTQFASQLADRTGLFVYNHALQGHGPFVPVYRFLSDDRFWQRPPQAIVWGFAEREIGGVFFERFSRELEWRGRRREATAQQDGEVLVVPQRIRVRWIALSPHRLRNSLPDTSFMAQTGQWGWNRLRYYLFGQLNPWVVVADRDVAGVDMLFFDYHIETLLWSEEARDPVRVAEVIAQFREYSLKRGIELIVVLIPEKEQVHRNAIPEHRIPPGEIISPSVLWRLEEELDQHHVQTVNLLGPFREAVAAGQQIYWRDDSHWNAAGIRIAADLVAERLNRSMP